MLGVLNDALNLLQRFQKSEGLRAYAQQRMQLVVPACALMLVTSLACALATVIFIGGTRPALVLLALVLMPVVLIGSLFVQGYVFASWLESRALTRALPHRAAPAHGWLAMQLTTRLGADMGSLPPVPWVMAALFLFLPLAMLVATAPMLATALIALNVLAPVLYARFDR